MTQLLAGLAIFFGVHSISLLSRRWRDRMVAGVGGVPWIIVYSLLSIAGLVLIVYGYGPAKASPVVLYQPVAGLQKVAMLLMLPVFLLVFAAYLPGRIRTATKHPMLLAVVLWSAGHLLGNGALADVLLFGAFLVWAIAVRVSLSRRVQRPMISAPAAGWNDAVAVVAGIAAHIAFLFGVHGWLIGAPLFPR